MVLVRKLWNMVVYVSILWYTMKVWGFGIRVLGLRVNKFGD